MDQNNGGDAADFSMYYTADNLQQMLNITTHGVAGMPMSSNIRNQFMARAQTVDELISQNQSELQRRRSYHHYFGSNKGLHEGGPKRTASMLEFGQNESIDLDGFQFDPSPTQGTLQSSMQNSPMFVTTSDQHDPATLQNGGGIAKRRMESRKARRASASNVGLETQFHDYGSGFGAMTQSPVYQTPHSATGQSGLEVPYFVPQNVAIGLPMGPDYSMGGQGTDMNGGISQMNMFAQQSFAPPMSAVMPPPMTSSIRRAEDDPGGGQMSGVDQRASFSRIPQLNTSENKGNLGESDKLRAPTPVGLPQGRSSEMVQDGSNFNTQPKSQLQDFHQMGRAINSFSTGGDAQPNVSGQPDIPHYLNAYSSTGFDMLGVLMRVAGRPKPRIHIGAVDMSCAFVVCDVSQHDMPIVYCSEMFERLTGYIRHEILGRNCRFLQAPDGKVQSGVKRKYVDDQAILHLKNMSNAKQEAQISLINYRKGGQPFMNLLTMIPIPWDTDEIRYYVGFQVDLVEQPTSITNKNPDGTYAINYQRGLLPGYVLNTPEANRPKDPEMSQTIERDEVSTILGTIGAGESELSKQIWDKVLLENTDDVVHVLSLKGLFQYLSPSCKKILEYEPHELVGTALSSVCHPSDIVPVTRELKDTSAGAAVNVVFRIRRKYSGYTWFESHGSLHTEQGKGKKCIVLVGRERPVYALARGDIVGGIGDSELWTKMSTSGLFLYVSAHSKSLLDRLPEELIGTSAQSLMRTESKIEFGRALEIARTGRRTSFKHDVQNKRGQTLRAETTIYPADATEGQKPTFLIAQTRLLKMGRGTPTTLRQNSNTSEKSQSIMASAGSLSPSTAVSGGTQGNRSAATPESSASNTNMNLAANGVVTQAGCHGLTVGNQDEALASEDNVFDELKTTRSTSWQFELRQMEKRNRLLAEELQSLLSNKKKRKRRKGLGQMQKDCANCHTRSTPEWRRGPSGNRDLCNSCGLRWAKQNGRVSPRMSQHSGDKHSSSPSPRLTNDKHVPTSPPDRISTQQQSTDSHFAKTSRMEASAAPGFGGGIPAKIEEGVEPKEEP